jgi:hypothetical protein
MSYPPPPSQGEEAFARNRAVISDDGVAIRLLVYSPLVAEPLGVVELSPEQALRLCADLAVAAVARLARLARGNV